MPFMAYILGGCGGTQNHRSVVADHLIAPGVARLIDVTGNRIHFAQQFACPSRGVERSGTQPGLRHNQCGRHGRDNAVAKQKTTGFGNRPGAQFTDQCTTLRLDAFEQRAVTHRSDMVEPAGEYGNGFAHIGGHSAVQRIQRSPMCRRIRAHRASGHDQMPGNGCLFGYGVCHIPAIFGHVP